MQQSHEPIALPRALPGSRREFLQSTGAGFGTVALASMLQQHGLLQSAAIAAETSPFAPRATHFPPKAKAVIWLFMPGSPSQVDTFDYKPELHKRNGEKMAGADPKTGFFTTSGKCLKSPFKFAQHGESGTWVSEIFPRTAQHVDDMAMLYSCFSGSNNHTPAMLSVNAGMPRQGFPCLGSWVNFGMGTENSNLPGFVVMHGPSKPRGGAPVWAPGFLPKVYQASVLNAGGAEPIKNLSRAKGLTAEQQRSQLNLLKSLNEQHEQQRPLESDLAARIESFELAYRMQAAAPEAVDVTRESAETQKLYGLERKESANFGRQCLIARRLVERGVRFVQIYSGRNGGGGGVGDVPWDGHSDIGLNHSECAKEVDQPMAALLTDLKARGMLDSTLVIWGGEFGRTSDSQGSKGRDHNPHAFTMWLAGGGVKGGAHYGASDEFGYKAVENRVSVHDLHATMLHLMGMDHEKLTYRFNGRDYRLTDVYGKVIKEVVA